MEPRQVLWLRSDQIAQTERQRDIRCLFCLDRQIGQIPLQTFSL
uniref:Uncharacterized protein n=1 Tax=Rhizophora mucronata TaxID=61149 RepID=A0A2P2JGG3_RHIMU